MWGKTRRLSDTYGKVYRVNKQFYGVSLGLLVLFLWFQPFVDFGLMYQSGQHIGGIAYLILFAGAGVMVFSWQRNAQLLLISGIFGTVISFWISYEIGFSRIGWGIFTIAFIAFPLSISLAGRFKKEVKTAA